MALGQRDRGQPENYRAGDQKLHVPGVPKIRAQASTQTSLCSHVKECRCGAFLLVIDYCSPSRR
jgi:hypothetical protein